MNGIEDEAINAGESFPNFERLSEIGREAGDQLARSEFVNLLVSTGEVSGEVLVAANIYIESVKSASAAEVQMAVGDEEKYALQIKEQVLHQIALIIALLDASCDLEDSDNIEQSDQVREEALTRLEEFAAEMQNILDDKSLIHREYFQTVLGQSMRILGH